MPLQQRPDVEFVRRVEAGVAVRHFLAQQAVGADDRRLAGSEAGVVVDDEQVVADLVETVAIAARQLRLHVGDRRHLLVEDLVAQLLRLLHLARRGGKAHFQRSDSTERFRQDGSRAKGFRHRESYTANCPLR